MEELLAERGLHVSYEAVRRWVLKFGPAVARRLRQRRPRPNDRWHLDEMAVRIAGNSREGCLRWQCHRDYSQTFRHPGLLGSTNLRSTGAVPKIPITAGSREPSLTPS